MELKDKERKSLPPQACLLIDDGGCRLCVSAKAVVERRGVDPARTGVKFVAYQSETARIALGQRDRLGQPETALFV